MAAGIAIAVSDNPTKCVVLGEGEREAGGGTGAARSDAQYLMR